MADIFEEWRFNNELKTYDSKFYQNTYRRIRVNLRRCVVCGLRSAGLRGHLFYQSGWSRFGAPFCKNHLEHFKDYAQPVFENPTALYLFKVRFSQAYHRNVEGKTILYFDTYKHNARIV